MKFERKFLLNYLPVNIDKFDKSEVIQAYISYEPELQLRKKDNKYSLIKKLNTQNIVRKEEVEINESLYNFLLNEIDNEFYKTKYFVPLSSKVTAEIDVYHNNLDGLKTVKVEFEIIKDAIDFEIPNWFGSEITNDKNFYLSDNHTKKKI